MKLLHFNQDVVLKVTFKGYKMQGLFHLLFFFLQALTPSRDTQQLCQKAKQRSGTERKEFFLNDMS